MRIIALAVALVAALFFVAPASAQCFSLSDTVTQLTEKGTPFQVLEGEDKDAFIADLRAAYEAKTGAVAGDMAEVLKVLVAVIGGEVYFGFEVAGGCLTAPAPLSQFLPEQKRSGWTPAGVFA